MLREEKTSWDSFETRPLLEGFSVCVVFATRGQRNSGRPTFLQERSGPRGLCESTDPAGPGFHALTPSFQQERWPEARRCTNPLHVSVLCFWSWLCDLWRSRGFRTWRMFLLY